MEFELNKLESLVRRSEIAKLKAEARLELLRTANSKLFYYPLVKLILTNLHKGSCTNMYM